MTGAAAAAAPRRLPVAKLVVLAVGAAVLLYLPQYYGPVEVERFTKTIVFAMAILGLNLLTGFSGQISLEHGAFFGIGAYTTAILVADHGWPHLLTVAVAAVICFAAGFVAGLPALRIRGLYLALTTLALATVFPTLIQRFETVTGGTQGKSVEVFESPIDSLAHDQWAYYLALAFAVVTFILVRNLVFSRVGRGLIAVRDNEVAAEVVGVDIARYKIVTFGLSAMIAGVAGALSIVIQPFPYIDARSFTIALSIQFLVGMVIGGAASIVGPVIGAIFIERAPDFITDTMGFDASLTNVVYGVALILLMFVAPGGVVGLYHRLQGIAARRLGRGGASRAVADAAFATPERLAAQAASGAADDHPAPVPTGAVPDHAAPPDLTSTKGTS